MAGSDSSQRISLKEIAQRSIQSHPPKEGLASSIPPSSRFPPSSSSAARNADLLASLSTRSSRSALPQPPPLPAEHSGERGRTPSTRTLLAEIPKAPVTYDVSDSPDVLLTPIPDETQSALLTPLSFPGAPPLQETTHVSSVNYALGSSLPASFLIKKPKSGGIVRWLIVAVWLILLVGLVAFGFAHQFSR